jgi:hypothetical protein
MNDMHVYSIQTYEKKNLHNCYGQNMTHEVCDDVTIMHLQNQQNWMQIAC